MTRFLRHWFGRTLDAGSMFLQQGPTEAYHSTVLLSLCLWGLCCVVLVGTYSSFILASAIATNVVMPFDVLQSGPYLSRTTGALFESMEGLAKCLGRGECQLLFPSLSASSYTNIMNAKGGVLADIRATFPANPVLEGTDEMETEAMLREAQVYLRPPYSTPGCLLLTSHSLTESRRYDIRKLRNQQPFFVRSSKWSQYSKKDM